MPARGTNAGDRVTLLYHAFELTHAAVQPLRMQSDALRYFCRSAFSPVAYTPLGKTMAAACEVFENVPRRYRKPDWHIDEVSISGHAAIGRASCRERVCPYGEDLVVGVALKKKTH